MKDLKTGVQNVISARQAMERAAAQARKAQRDKAAQPHFQRRLEDMNHLAAALGGDFRLLPLLTPALHGVTIQGKDTGVCIGTNVNAHSFRMLDALEPFPFEEDWLKPGKDMPLQKTVFSIRHYRQSVETLIHAFAVKRLPHPGGGHDWEITLTDHRTTPAGNDSPPRPRTFQRDDDGLKQLFTAWLGANLGELTPAFFKALDEIAASENAAATQQPQGRMARFKNWWNEPLFKPKTS